MQSSAVGTGVGLDWIQFSILIVTIIGTIGFPVLTGLVWLLNKITALDNTVKQLVTELHSLRKAKSVNRRMLFELRDDVVQIKTLMKIPIQRRDRKKGRIIRSPDSDAVT